MVNTFDSTAVLFTVDGKAGIHLPWGRHISAREGVLHDMTVAEHMGKGWMGPMRLD